MYTTSKTEQDDATLVSGETLQMSALVGYAALILSEAEELGSARVRGTVEASVETADHHDFGRQSETLIHGAPLSQRTQSTEPLRPKLRAKDLVDELHAINAQIHHIMFQVEQAVARLAPSS